MKLVEFNVNRKVWVQLTALGEKMYRDYWAPYNGGKPVVLPEAKDGWIRFQMSELMAVFGSALAVPTLNVPFNTNIRLEFEE